jgi:chromosomal replication initiator protein
MASRPDVPLRPDLTFERFTPTPGTRRAVRLCRALVHASSQEALLLVGPPGTGKTHLLQAVAHAIAAESAWATVANRPARLLCDELMDTIRRDCPTAAVSEKYARYTVVLIDDVQELAGKPATQHQIAMLIAKCLSSGARVLCAATRWPFHAELAGSAWAQARVVRMTPPKTEAMAWIVRRASATEVVRPNTRTTRLLAQHSRGDVRRALGALAVWRLRHAQALLVP